MFDLDKFAKQLAYLIDDENKLKNVAAEINVEESTLYRYIHCKHIPDLKILIDLADYFECTILYLLGLEENDNVYRSASHPAFHIQFQKYLKANNTNAHAVSRAIKIPYNTVLQWSKGIYEPSIEGVLLLAKHFNISVDEFLGR